MQVAENAYQEFHANSRESLRIALPEPSLRLEQDAEWCLIETPDGWREIRFHDYAELYKIPGLYERIFYDILNCNSPATIRGLLEEHIRDENIEPSDLRVLDLGAGNGMVGEEFADMGVKTIVGVDIVEAARESTERDRPGIYTDYLVTDMTNLNDPDLRRLEEYRFNCLTCVAALGFGDIPPDAFVQAYQLIRPEGLIAFNIKHTFLEERDSSGFARLICMMIEEDILAISCKTRYQHRLATNGDPLEYVAFVGNKLGEVPDNMLVWSKRKSYGTVVLMDNCAGQLTPEQRQFLEQRRREVERELEKLRVSKPGPPYEDRHERYQDLRDELDEIERQLGIKGS